MTFVPEMLGIDGMFWWKDRQRLVVICAGRGYSFNSLGGMATEFTSPNVRFKLNEPVSFATSGSLLFMANKGRIVKWSGSGFAAYEESDLAPEFCSGVAVSSKRLLAVAYNTQRVHLTEMIDEKDTTITWKPTWFNISSQSDNVVQVAASWAEMVFWGTVSTEFWYFTGQETTETDVPFARIEGSVVERGISAPGSAIQANNTWHWLDHERRFIQLENRSPKIISLPIDRILRSYTRVDDCRGFLMDRWLVWTFPTEKVTWVYDLITQAWQKWGFWNPDTGLYEAYLGISSAYITEWNAMLIGGRKDGYVYRASVDLGTDNGKIIRTLYRSAHFDHGTSNRKRCRRLSMRLKRGL